MNVPKIHILLRRHGIELQLLLLFVLALTSLTPLVAQSVYENKYVQVLETKDCNDTIIVADLIESGGSQPWLAVDDRVLIIQMKGGNVKHFGDHYITKDKESGPVRHYNGVGSFEFATVEAVEAVTGTNPQQYRVLLDNPLKNLYEAELWGGKPNGVQLVRIPTDGTNGLYEDIIVTGITAPDWDGTTGGVYALEITGDLTLRGNIDVSGAGYRGGDASSEVPTSRTERFRSRRNKVMNPDQYDYSGNDYQDQLGADKGEGVGDVTFIYRWYEVTYAGRGAAGNGGGGGNSEGAGGGGGANYGAGGIGGMQRTLANEDDLMNGGEGGYAIEYGQLGTRALMGGGGGGGHEGLASTPNADIPSRTVTDGANGGGIIIIRAAKIIVDNVNGKLLANGDNSGNATDAGAGGGGAGGSIILSVGTYQVSQGKTLSIEAKGGNGGNSELKGAEKFPSTFPNTYFPIGCFGPGGGGGGGLVWVSGKNSPASGSLITVSTDGGDAGHLTYFVDALTTPISTTTPDSNCPTGSKRGAADGENGKTLTGLILPGDPLP